MRAKSRSSESERYRKLLKLRGYFKRASQVTWTIRESEQRFALNNPENEEILMDIYKDQIDELESTVENAKKEFV